MPKIQMFCECGASDGAVDVPEAGITSTGGLQGPHPTTVHAATWKVALKKRPPPDRWATLSLNSNASWVKREGGR